MELFTPDQQAQLLANGAASAAAILDGYDPPDPVPVVKLFTPDAGATWLLTEIDPEETDIAFGLCDLGVGHPEVGSVSIAELRALRGRLGLPVERDLYAVFDRPLSAYAAAAHRTGRITLAL